MSGSSGMRSSEADRGAVHCGVLPAAARPRARASRHACQRVVLTGEVQAGQEWKAAFGQGWIFRVVPVQPGKEGYSGWDLVVDREAGAGYPGCLAAGHSALLLHQ